MVQLTKDLQRSSGLLSRSEHDLQSKSDELHQMQQQLANLMASSYATKPVLHPRPVQHHRVDDNGLHGTDQQQGQQEQSEAVAAAAVLSHPEDAAAAEAVQEAEMLREKLHDSVELLEEADRQLKLKVAEVDECKMELSATQQELSASQLQLHETQALLEEHADLLQQHNEQLLQAQEELQVSQNR